jgi:hypothetical protein
MMLSRAFSGLRICSSSQLSTPAFASFGAIAGARGFASKKPAPAAPVATTKSAKKTVAAPPPVVEAKVGLSAVSPSRAARYWSDLLLHFGPEPHVSPSANRKRL